jgi:hypothetical protein
LRAVGIPAITHLRERILHFSLTSLSQTSNRSPSRLDKEEKERSQ